MARGKTFALALRSLVILACAGLLLALLPSQADAQSAKVRRITGSYGGEMLIPIGKSELLGVDVEFERVSVGNPEVADVLPLSNQTIYVLGRTLGRTNLSVFGENDNLMVVVDLVVGFDIRGLKAKLSELLPNERIAVREANSGVILSGNLSTGKAVSEALAIANRFAPGHVSNLMTATGSQQVMLEVVFAEVQRGFTRGMESELRVFGDGFFMGTDFIDTFARSFFAGGNFDIGSASVNMLFNFLESKNVAKVLAEPTLVAMSGDTASFLAGGEFPVQVAIDTDTVGIEFKDFGVGLAFTPTVLDSGLINILVRPEVSVPVDTVVEGVDFDTPALQTRRAETTVELGDGQSFMIAGMLSSSFSDDVTQLPWFGDIPIIGALGRSAEYSRRETELVIIVTPHLIKPVDAGMLATPDQNLYAPNEMQLFGFGMVEAPGPTRNVGLARPYGHILE